MKNFETHKTRSGDVWWIIPIVHQNLTTIRLMVKEKMRFTD